MAKKTTKPAKKAAKPAAKKAPAKKAATKKPAAKKVAAKKPVKKAAAKKPSAKKPAPKKVAAKKPVKKLVAKKPAKKVAAKKPAAKPAKKVAAKKPAPKKPEPKKVAPKAVAKPAPAVKVKPVAAPVKPEPKAAKPAKPAKPARREYDGSIDPEPHTPQPIVIPQQTIRVPEGAMKDNENRVRYSDKELEEFKVIILKKLDEARKDYELLKATISHKDDHGTDDTSPTFKLLEDGSDVLSKEESNALAVRQQKFIQSLENALIRIQNKTYGICRVTGKLISKERLRVVPHATLSIEAKNMQQ